MSRRAQDWDVEAGGVTVRITHPDKVLFPQIGATKRDVVRYYLDVAERLLPALHGRALVLHRYPDGLRGESFFQKRAPANRPEWVSTATLPSPTNEEPIEYVLGNNLATVVWLVNQGAFEMNPWLALAERPEEPTHLAADLDPMGGPFREVCQAALLVREALETHGYAPQPKTSGKTGLHVMAPLRPGATYPAVRQELQEIGRELEGKHPHVFAIEERVKERAGQIYFDYNQNGYGSTIAAAYSVRPTPAATISMPLTWEQVDQAPDPRSFTIRG